MYQATLFLHVASAFLYFLLHGAVAGVAFVLGRQRHPKAAEGLESILDFVNPAAPLSLGVTIMSGIVLGFMGRWWRWGWIWLSLALLALIWIVMSRLGNRHFDREFDRIYGADEQFASEHKVGTELAEQEQSSGILTGNAPAVLALLGIIGMLAILWLMMLKPF